MLELEWTTGLNLSNISNWVLDRLDVNVTAICILIYPHRRGKIPFCTVPDSTNRVGKRTVDHQKSYNYECLALPAPLKKVEILSPWVVVTKVVAQTDTASQGSASGQGLYYTPDTHSSTRRLGQTLSLTDYWPVDLCASWIVPYLLLLTYLQRQSNVNAQ